MFRYACYHFYCFFYPMELLDTKCYNLGTLYSKNQNKCYLNVEKTALAMTTLLTLTTSKLFSSSSDMPAKSSKYSYIFTPVMFSGGEVLDLTGVEVM